MRGDEKRSEGLFSYVRLEERIAGDLPLRAIKALVEDVRNRPVLFSITHKSRPPLSDVIPAYS